MHGEAQIKVAIRVLLEKYKQLRTSDIKEKLNEVIIFDEEDLQASDTRNETKIKQRIGNVVSHQAENFKIYPEGFSVDKSKKNAVFSLINGLNNKRKSILSSSIPALESRPLQKDWLKEQEEKTSLGLFGENYIYHIELDKVSKFGDNFDLTRVIHVSVSLGDGLGYDILSLNESGETIYIEVKTTKGNEFTPFYLSRNEYEFINTHCDSAFIYRVYNFDLNTKTGNYKIITPKELTNDYNLDPVTYMVTKKNI